MMCSSKLFVWTRIPTFLLAPVQAVHGFWFVASKWEKIEHFRLWSVFDRRGWLTKRWFIEQSCLFGPSWSSAVNLGPIPPQFLGYFNEMPDNRPFSPMESFKRREGLAGGSCSQQSCLICHELWLCCSSRGWVSHSFGVAVESDGSEEGQATVLGLRAPAHRDIDCM